MLVISKLSLSVLIMKPSSVIHKIINKPVSRVFVRIKNVQGIFLFSLCLYPRASKRAKMVKTTLGAQDNTVFWKLRSDFSMKLTDSESWDNIHCCVTFFGKTKQIHKKMTKKFPSRALCSVFPKGHTTVISFSCLVFLVESFYWSINRFGWDNHFGQVQIIKMSPWKSNLNLSKMICTRLKWIGRVQNDLYLPIQIDLDGPKSIWTYKRTRRQPNSELTIWVWWLNQFYRKIRPRCEIGWISVPSFVRIPKFPTTKIFFKWTGHPVDRVVGTRLFSCCTYLTEKNKRWPFHV